jgi:alpha-tubulin suppressor-like RCC1 family protein
MFTTDPLPLTLHQDWKLKLSEWAADGSLGAAAQAAFRLEGRPAELAALISQWAAGDFSALPPIVLLPASSMPGAAGAYAISTGNIYLNQDWLAGASAAQVIAVLTEELGHHLDGFLNVVDTPGDEGEWFAALLTGGVISEGQRQALLAENDHGMVRAGDQVLAVEQAATWQTFGYREGGVYGCFAELKADGSVVPFPLGRFEGFNFSSADASQLSSGVSQIFYTLNYNNLFSYGQRGAFAALKADGSVVTLGDFDFGGDSSALASQLSSGVSQIFRTLGYPGTGFAALKADGSVVTWGGDWYGGHILEDISAVASQLRSGVSQIFATNFAFAALKSDGSVVTWGGRSYEKGWGGDSSAVASQLSSGVSQIFSTEGAFAALKADGSVVTWGNADSGGNSSAVASQLSSGVSQIFSTEGAFAALKSDGSVVTWGSDSYGGNESVANLDYRDGYYDFVYDSVAFNLTSDVSQIFSTISAFAALKADGSVVTWGDADSGGNSSAVASQLSSGVSQIFVSDSAFAALKADGSVVTWGNSSYGGNSSAVASQLSSGVSQIFSTSFAFAALKSDGSVVTWGEWGGDSNAVASQLSSGVSQIFSTGFAFAALKADRSVVTWGRSNFYGGDSSEVASQLLTGVSKIFVTDSAFAALKADGSVVTWGEGVYDTGEPGVIYMPLTRAMNYLIAEQQENLANPTVANGTLALDYNGDGKFNQVDESFVKQQASLALPGTPEREKFTNQVDLVRSALRKRNQFSNIEKQKQIAIRLFDYNGDKALNRADLLFKQAEVQRTGSAKAKAEVELLKAMGVDENGVPLLPVIITLAVAPTTGVAEDGTSNLAYTFSRIGLATNPLTVNYTVGGTATLGTDYASIAATSAIKTVTFAAGAATATVIVDPTADVEIEADETVAITLAAGVGYSIGTTAAVVGTITNDDTPVITLAVAPATVTEDGTTNLIYTFTRTGPATSALSVKYKVGGTATLGTDYTGIAATPATKTVNFADGSATATLTINPTADTTIEANETVSLTLAAGTGYSIGTTAAVTGTITNDDFPVITLAVAPATVTEDGTTNLIYTFTRTGPATSALSVKYKVGGTATLGTDYTGIAATPATKTVNFADGSATATLTINPTADTTIEANETVSLTLAAGTGYTIGTTAAVTGTITNDDFPVITLAVAPATVTEDSTTNLVYTFSRTGPTSSALSVKYTVGGTATLGTDYTGIASTPATKTVSFAAGSATATVTVDPKADTTIEANETVALTLAAGKGYSIGTTAAVVGTITNDDVSSSTTYTLSPTQSSLQLLGGMRINGIGNDLNNTITGNNKNNKLHGLLGADTLTGGGTADSDVFAYNSLGESLLGTGSSFDLITDFNNRDFILAPLTVETERLSSAIGSVNSLTSASIEGLLTASSFAANSVAAFTVAGQVGTYIAMNDGRGGFQADSDAIVFLPNYAISNVNFVEFI